MDGQRLAQVNLFDLRNSIGIVPQDAFLFSDSIKNNIKFGKESATDEEVVDAALKHKLSSEEQQKFVTFADLLEMTAKLSDKLRIRFSTGIV